jgi:hypothetical protein
MIRDRIKSLRRVKASDLKPNPRNWRQHPDTQRTALSAVLEEVGYADALLARELPDGSLDERDKNAIDSIILQLARKTKTLKAYRIKDKIRLDVQLDRKET